jgi:hypothetical protein
LGVLAFLNASTDFASSFLAIAQYLLFVFID